MTSPVSRADLAQLIPPEFHGHLGFMLSKAHRALLDEVEPVVGDGLSIRHFAVLSVVQRRQGLRQTDIGEVIGIDRTTTMKLLDELEHAGMLRRRPHAEDRRANALELTAKGRATRERILPRLVEQEAVFLQPLSPGERLLLQELLLRLITTSFDRKRKPPQ
jgi:DNA-binding MarR family transcriptional regulator